MLWCWLITCSWWYWAHAGYWNCSNDKKTSRLDIGLRTKLYLFSALFQLWGLLIHLLKPIMFLDYVCRLSSLECKTFTCDTLGHNDILDYQPTFFITCAHVFFVEPKLWKTMRIFFNMQGLKISVCSSAT
jgi:hypothetical protein